ncbi:glycosyl transferase family protein [Leptolyngbya sp. Heron Island J]|uniref:glycosyl transferase n=1 Tax=Leptolyngbya sp. Heron Island J TaxID=1385935 RepID=UPI0003B9DE4B|nr:glycosyl transferase [Leptolyngbya sp. Heron Island J]ESA37061.1 glycosyl transferase family protein [Leptolyngbya sp. Heron Island J]
MRAIDSAITLSHKLQKQLTVIWLENTPQLRCPFDKLFQPIPQVNITSPQLTSIYLNPQTNHGSSQLKQSFLSLTAKVFQQINFQKVIDNDEVIQLIKNNRLETLANYQSLMIWTDRSFYPDNTYGLFKPIPVLEKAIRTRTADFGNYTVGIHIRRGDHRKSIQHSPLDLFRDAIAQEITQNPDTNFYLASDSLQVKHQLIKEFGDRIITQLAATSRNNEQGMQAAVLDLYALSRTRKIYGSYWSSYSRVAANISNIDLIILNAPTP